MKKKHFFAIALFSLIPISAFAVYGESYGMIVGCGINTIPKFIKASLDLVIKVGIPVASVFLIFAGFQFLTAQGNDSKLTAAKSAFLYSCVGFGVLLGAWLFSTAFVGIMTSITGGNAESITITPCGSEQSSVQQQNHSTLSPVVEIVLSAEGNTHAGLGTIFGVGGECAAYGGPYVPNDIMEQNSLESGDPALLQKSLSIVHRDAILQPTEQAYLFVQFASGGGAFLHTAGGSNMNTEFPPHKTIEGIVDQSLSGVSGIHIIHTHPKAFLEGKLPPSLPDLLIAEDFGNNNPRTVYYHHVADFRGVWQYSVPSSSEFSQKVQTMKVKMKEILVLSEVKNKISIDKCSSPASVSFAFADALGGTYGGEAKCLAEELNNAASVMEPFVEQDSRILSSNSFSEKQSIFNERESTERSLGVSLQYTPM